MISFEEAGRILDEEADALPKEIYERLNGGVNLLEQTVRDENGLCVLGRYFCNSMGRYVELYYGSFLSAYRGAGEIAFRKALSDTLRHELTHHIEGLAGDRSLEKWDAENIEKLLAPHSFDGPLDSPLFADGYRGPGEGSLLRRRRSPATDFLERREDDDKA